MKREQNLEHLIKIESEIEDLLKDFEGENIHIPEARLEKALDEKLNNLQKPKKHQLAKIATGIGLFVLVGSFAVPQVQVFAKEVIESIFKDKGIEKAAQAGYPAIRDVEGMIGEYKVRLFNIYIDAMRLSFEAEVIGLPEEKELQVQKLSYFLNIDDEWIINGKKVEEVGIGTGSFNSGQYASIEVQGYGVAALLAEDEIQIPLKLQSSKYSDEGDNGGTLIGKTTFTLQIPEELHQPTKMYVLDQEVTLEKGNIHFEYLEVSPTMMTLKYSSHIEDGYITGLNNVKIVGKNQTYDETAIISSSFDEKGGVKEYIIPSIYFEKEKEYVLQAEGYEYDKEKLEEMTIDQLDSLPKAIMYEGIPLTITTLNYQEGVLEVGILDKYPKKQGLSKIYINGIPNQGMSIRTSNYDSGDLSKPETREYIVKIKVPEAESYVLSIEFTLQKEEAITIPIKLK